MSQVNNPTGLPKSRPMAWNDFEKESYLGQMEEFVRQVYENLTGITQIRVYTVAELPDASDFDPSTGDGGACVFPENGANNHCDGRPEITSFRKITIPIAENR